MHGRVMQKKHRNIICIKNWRRAVSGFGVSIKK